MSSQARPTDPQAIEPFQRTLEAIPAGAYMCDPEGRITYYNPRAVELWGRAPALHHSSELYCGAHRLYNASGAPIPHDESWMAKTLRDRVPYLAREIVLERPDGERVLVLAFATPLWGPDGRLAGAVNVLVDTTEQKRSETLALENEARMRAVIDNAVDAILTIDERGTIENVNPAVERLFGYKPDELIGRNVKVLMPSPDRERHDSYLDAYARTGTRKIIGIGREVTAIRKDKTTFAAELAVSEFTVAGKRHYTGMLRDVSARRRTELDLAERELRLREAVAYDLHDSVGQTLAGARLHAQGLLRDAPQELRARVARLSDLISMATDKVRSVSQSLAPPEVAGTSLRETLDSLAQKAAALLEVRVQVEVATELREPPSAQRNQVSHIVQEALLNAVRHGEATLIEVHLDFEHGWYHLHVRDNGHGLPTKASDSSPGLGLASMQHRSRLIGGSLRVQSRDEGGTEVFLSWPAA